MTERIGPSDPVTPERLERALVYLAYLITVDGPIYTPLFDRLEQEILETRRQATPLERAQRVLAAYTTGGGTKAIC
jgi:hypothetical protein